MNTDSTFQIGKNHKVCEDYALSGVVEDIGYAIVCDGCSASPDVDFGARVMAFAVRRILHTSKKMNNPKLITDPQFFKECIITNISLYFTLFPDLSPYFLDTTLLVAIVQNKRLNVHMFGDGVFVRKTKSGGFHTVHINLTSGAPDYLSYHLDDKRKESYNALEKNKKELVININGIVTEFESTLLQSYSFESDIEEGDIIAVISDGINSFRKANNDSIPWEELVDEFTGFKNTNGEFATRRILAFQRKCAKEGITHSDDISIASIVC